jgi:C-terminal processing protease CtpA/Prc
MLNFPISMADILCRAPHRLDPQRVSRSRHHPECSFAPASHDFLHRLFSRNPLPPFKLSGRGKHAYSGRILVLIDDRSASSVEILAAGLQDLGRAIIVGRKSSGQVLKNFDRSLPNGFRASIPIRDYRTAKGVRLEGCGVIPDEPVVLTMRGFVVNRDPDLERAQELVRKPG